ncbi:polymer-forming cytoskeletal protein [Longimicrobium sp.]|uniref:polymer-forming cytoskeletal protein n=1 Tax=Longimicrobium sp. TaxID=2029185 RepID=UPI002D198CAB|nr:polymer-forming cytoskeletal protein [Longimicrobium sp.]HSU12594.1 polymer-forming cytoskeletal protein [Longimicrobium sp.]
MRTEILKLSALALAFASAPALRAQGAPPAPPAPAGAPAADVAAAPQVLAPAPLPAEPAVPQPEGSRIAFNGLTVPAGKVVDGDVVAPFGDVRVEGEVMGDVTVGRGNLVLAHGAVIHGDAVVNGGGKLFNEGGRVFGEMRVNSSDDDGAGRAAPADEGRGRGRREAAEAMRMRHGWWGSMTEGFEGLVSALTLGLILCGIGAALVFYALPQLERVSHTVRRDAGRSFGIGIAANFLTLPAFIIGIVVLAVTLIGIPLLLLYIPLFGVALAAAGGLGVLGVAHALGERTAEQGGSFASMRRNAYTYVFTGVGVLVAPQILGNLLKLTGFLGWLGMIVNGFGYMVLWLAATIGFGAVVLTRAGTRAGWPWKPRPAAYDPIFDEEPAFDRSGAGV